MKFRKIYVYITSLTLTMAVTACVSQASVSDAELASTGRYPRYMTSSNEGIMKAVKIAGNRFLVF